ncbi:MAG: HAD-IA family hydrolase [Candidatus Binataceae bacterium]
MRRRGGAESTVYKGVVPMLTELRGAARLYVVTSKNTAAAERMLGLCGLKRYFEIVVGNGRLDDKSDMVGELIQSERLDRTATAMVGDRGHDVVAGKRNGIFTVGVAYGYGSREELAAAGADRICESPADVARVLGG